MAALCPFLRAGIKLGVTLKKFLTSAFAATLLVAVATPAAAKVVVEANGARADGHWGGELGLGYAVGFGGFKITPAVGALIYAGDNDRYFTDPNGGSSRCRDSANGQYADTDKCNNTAVKAYGRIEATYTVPASFTFGAGVRISDEVRPYGTIAFPLAPKLSLKGNAGPHYYAAGLHLGF